MKRSTGLMLLLFFGLAFLCWSLPAAAQEQAEAPKQEEPPSFTTTASVDVFSQYVWRGMALSEGSAVFQPSLAFSYAGFAASIWGNADTHQARVPQTGFKDGARLNETDITVSYTKEILPKLSLTGGVISYQFSQFPNLAIDSLLEVYGGASYVLPYDITVAFTTYREVTHNPGWWFQLDLTRSFPLPYVEGMSLDLGASFGYMILEPKDQTLDLGGNTGDYSAPHSGTLTAGLKIPVHKYLTITPKVGLAFPLSGEANKFIKANSWDADAVHPFGGVNFTASF
jgi:uncharacterized protein (TIGR02001 family)